MKLSLSLAHHSLLGTWTQMVYWPGLSRGKCLSLHPVSNSAPQTSSSWLPLDIFKKEWIFWSKLHNVPSVWTLRWAQGWGWRGYRQWGQNVGAIINKWDEKRGLGTKIIFGEKDHDSSATIWTSWAGNLKCLHVYMEPHVSRVPQNHRMFELKRTVQGF